jgi:EAL domain-containing protein (putative c-di-GMP-specific phosphodiesterase class I)
MYVAKTSGKDSVRLFDPSMHERAHERFRLQVDLRGALEREELLLFYQPIYDMYDGQLKGFEALVRWSHPSRGLIAPERFIPLAEESGLIVPIGRWVLEQALRQITAWDRRHSRARDVSISVNVSTVQLTAPSLISDVRSAIERTGIAPSRVVLEITEGSLAKDPERTIEVLERLRELGLRIAIDDFGTGYCALAYLQDLPVDELKLDRSFAARINADVRSAAIVRSTIELAHALGLRVVAEGVEDRQTLEAIESFGCDSAQGFYFSPPVPAAAFAVAMQRPKVVPATRALPLAS